MTIHTLKIAGANEDGFLARETVRQHAVSMTPEDFRAAYPSPALLVVHVSLGAGGGDADATLKAGPQLITLFSKGASAYRYVDQVAFLVKRPDSTFSRMVSVGRAQNNDVVLAVESVSKFHAYFSSEGHGWSVTDYRSTNGTKLNGTKLEPTIATPIADGDTVQFGSQIKLRFWLPESLQRVLKS